MLPTKSQVNWPFGSREEARTKDFQIGHLIGHLGFPIWTILAIFNLRVDLMLPVKLQVNWPFGSGEEGKVDFQDGSHVGRLGFPIGTILAIVYIYKSPRCFLTSQLAFRFRRRCEKTDFQDGFPVGTILAISDLQVILMLPLTFQVTVMLPIKFRQSKK